MDDSESSSEDECNLYVNAASKLNALNQQIKLKHDDDEDENFDISIDNPKISSRLNRNQTNNENTNDSFYTYEQEIGNHVNCNNKENDLVICIEDDDCSDNIPTRRTTRNSNKKKNTVSSNIESVIILDDSIEEELNQTFSLQENEENDRCVIIGTPVPDIRSNNENYEVNVKILWRSNKMNRFEIRRYETFQKVFKHFSNLEGVPENQILIMKNEKCITPFDTPASIDWSIIDILDGGIVSPEIAKKNKENFVDSVGENVCKIKVQISDKKSLQVILKPTETFAGLMHNCAEQLNIPESKLKFYFDGELIDINETPESLDLDDKACVDLKISN